MTTTRRRRLLSTTVILIGCGGGGGPSLVPSSAQQQENVMLIDEGIDLSVADLQGRVAGAYTETCQDDSSDGADGGSIVPAGGPVKSGPAFDALKQAVIASFSQVDDSCHLKTGISGKADPMAKIAKYKQRWNQMIRANQTGADVFTSTEWSEIQGPLQAEFENFGYHGTSTSTTISHAYPGVRLVLVERQLMSESQVQSGFHCLDQAEIDQFVYLLNDPDVFAAAAAQKATLDTDLATAMTDHHVGLVNESFGASARVVLEKLQVDNQCASPIDLSAYFTVLTAVDAQHASSLTGPAVLTVRAAGNDGAQINTGADALDCVPGDPTSLVVGSYNPANGVQNTFSNFGGCVDLYAPGQAIVTTYAGGWLLPVDGTSFASPLTVRFVSMNAPSPFTVASARQHVLGQVDATGELPATLFPSDFFYTPLQVNTDALVALPVQRASRRGVSRVDVHRVLAPLQRFRALSGR
ncbi:MAG TPA: S8 family serine peptidase [Polyangia bacterium]|nr:S8 family serine peptidase [Polyangia bacterium]